MNQVYKSLTYWTATITLLALVVACSPTESSPEASQSMSTSTQMNSNNEPKQAASKPTPLSLPKTTHQMGEPVLVEDKNLNLQLTVNGVREHQGKGVIKPNQGNKWVVVSTTIANKGQKPETISVVSFEVLDNKNKPYEVALLASALEDVKSPSGEIQPGDEKQGEVAFEVPKAAEDLKLQFFPNRSACEAPTSKSEASGNCERVVVQLQ